MQSNITWRTAPFYLEEAYIYHMGAVSAVTLQLCAVHFEQLNYSRFNGYAPELFVQIMEHAELKCESTKLSIAVAKFFACVPRAQDHEAAWVRNSTKRLLPKQF